MNRESSVLKKQLKNCAEPTAPSPNRGTEDAPITCAKRWWNFFSVCLK